MSRVLAADLGGSALKVCLYSIDGKVLATAAVPLGFDEDQTGRSEQDPQVWWGAFGRAVQELDRQAGALTDVSAVVTCGFTRTQIFLDSRNEVIRPAMGFRDSRALGAADHARSRKDVVDHPHARHLNGFHPLARLLWLKHNEPDCWNATRLVIEPKDYINFKLTGIARSDRISQFWLHSAMRDATPSLASLTGIDRNVLPEIGKPQDRVGRVSANLPGALSALAGAQVFCGSNDTWAAVAGLGALRPARAYCISGSSEVLGLLSGHEAEAEGLITIPWDDDLWHIGGPGQNGANVLRWVVDMLDSRNAAFAERLGTLLKAKPGGPPLIFHPYLHGERTPFWDRDLRASFLGLTQDHGSGDLVRAVMEGVAYVNRLVLERAEQAVGTPADDVRMAGGGARSGHWNQIRANVLGRPVVVSHIPDMGLSGCQALARVGLGLAADIASAVDASQEFTHYLPDPEHTARYDTLYRIFRDTHDTMADASHRLARLGRGQLQSDPA